MSAAKNGARLHTGLDAAAWTVLAVASAGWVFDVYEGQLFTIFKTPMLAELTGGSSAAIALHGNLGFAAFLLGGAAGGLIFGVLADRFGRVRMLAVTILVYSVFSGLTALAGSSLQVLALRFLVALGAGGEWAIAAALVAETFPARARAWASGIFHASSILGSGLASLSGMIFVGPGGWRWAFVLGLAPALLVFWIRMSLREGDLWTAVRQSAEGGGDAGTVAGDAPAAHTDSASASPALGNLGELFGCEPWRGRAFVGLGLATIGLATYWGIFAWTPELVGLILGDQVPSGERQAAGSRVYLLMNFTGGLLGLLAFAPLASWRGRRFTFAFYQLGAAIVAPVVFLGARTYVQALWLLPVMAFFVLGMHAGYAIYFPELFPTRLRATGSSVCFNLGRVLGAAILVVRGTLGSALGLRGAVAALSGLFWVGLLILIFAPETRGSELPE
jgi:MFS family permease